MLRPVYVAAFALSASLTASAATDLPTVTIMGKTFYTYVADKGESLFGIANKFGWDPELLVKTNRELETPLDKGALVYYPVPKAPKTSKGSRKSSASEVLAADTSDTLAAFSAHDEASPSASVPDTEESYPSEADDDYADTPILYIATDSEEADTTQAPDAADAQADVVRDGVLYHTVQPGESLYGISQAYETTVEDLYKMNPGISYSNPDPGETIRIRTGSRNEAATPTMVTENQVTGLVSYKVRRGDTWASVAQAKGIDVDLLKKANPDKAKLKRGDTIVIPDMETVEVERMVVTQDPRETTEEGRRELYNEVHSLDSRIYDADGNISPNAISVAIVLADPDSNRDMEFARGAVMAVNQFKGADFPTRLTIIDGSKPQSEVIGALEGFAPTIVVTTTDRDLPPYLTDYVKDNSRHLINAFDVKSEAYLNNPAVIQYLAPTSYFNDEVASYITSTFTGYELLIAGKMDGNDTMGEAILRAKVADTDAMPQELPAEELADLTLSDEQGRYLIYATPSGKEDVKAILDKTAALRERYPLADIRVIGRPSWITMVEGMRHTFDDNRVILPSRFYFDADDSASRRFIDGYRTLFGHTPMKSYPVYSATAYDILSYFLPNISSTHGDFNASFSNYPTLQTPISLDRVNNWGGLVNPDVYLVEFQPFGSIKKTVLDSSSDE